MKEWLRMTADKLSLEDFLLPDDHPLVQLELGRLRATPEAPMVDSGAKTLWVHDHREFYENKGIPWLEPTKHKGGKGLCPYNPQAEANNPWYASRTDREKHFIHGYDVLAPLHGGPDGGKEEILELGKNITWSSRVTGRSHAVTPGGQLWLRRRARLVLGAEKMQLQGMYVGTYCGSKLSSSRLADLAGNAVSNHCWSVIATAFFAS